MMGLVAILAKCKRKSNIIDFTLTALKRQLKWWGSSINQHRSWGLMSKDSQIVHPNKRHPTKMLMEWILSSLLAISSHLWMKNQCSGTDKEMSTQEGLIESLNLYSHQLGNLNKILTRITLNPTWRLTSIIILPCPSLIWFTRTQIWSNKYRVNHFQLPTQMGLEKS